MASEIRVNKIANRAGLSTVQYTDTGIIVSGIVTATELSGLSALNISGVGTATTLDINGDIDVDGHTNLDNLSVAGVSTFSNNITLNGGLVASSSVTAGQILVGSGVTIESNQVATGQATFTGIVTASSFRGDGSQLTGITQTTINSNTNNYVVTATGTANTLQGESTLTFDGDTLLLKSSTDGRRVSFAGDGTSHYMKYDNTLGGIILNGYGGIAFETNGTNERLRIDGNGRLLVSRSGLTASKNVGTKTGEIQVAAGGNNAAITLINFENSAASPYLMLGKSRAGNSTGNTIVQADDRLGEIAFCGADGNDIDSFGAAIKAWVDGTPGNNDMPGRLAFYTTADGGQSAQERMTIKKDGKIGIGRNDPVNFVDIARGQDEENILLVRGADNSSEYGALGIHSGNYVITGGGAGSTNTGIMFRTATSGNETNRLHITSSGNVEPATDNTYNFGSLTKRWANIYTADLNLSNEGKANDVDGTWGQYTIQEGQDDLFLINKRNGKKYMFVLKEVS